MTVSSVSQVLFVLWLLSKTMLSSAQTEVHEISTSPPGQIKDLNVTSPNSQVDLSILGALVCMTLAGGGASTC